MLTKTFTLGIDESDVDQMMVERMPFAYLIYDDARDRSVSYVRDYLTSHYPTLHPMGRKRHHHRYDNRTTRCCRRCAAWASTS